MCFGSAGRGERPRDKLWDIDSHGRGKGQNTKPVMHSPLYYEVHQHEAVAARRALSNATFPADAHNDKNAGTPPTHHQHATGTHGGSTNRSGTPEYLPSVDTHVRSKIPASTVDSTTTLRRVPRARRRARRPDLAHLPSFGTVMNKTPVSTSNPFQTPVYGDRYLSATSRSAAVGPQLHTVPDSASGNPTGRNILQSNNPATKVPRPSLANTGSQQTKAVTAGHGPGNQADKEPQRKRKDVRFAPNTVG